MVTRKLYWLLIGSVALGSLLLFALLYQANDSIAQKLSIVDDADQTQLQAWAHVAQTHYEEGDFHSLRRFLQHLNQDQQVLAVVLTNQLQPVAGVTVPDALLGKLNYQRKLHWPVHVHWDEVVIGIPFTHEQASFVVLLPEHMHPKPQLGVLKFVLTVVVPLAALLLLTHFLYRYLIWPLRTLKTASRQLATATLNYPVKPLLGKRQDELSELAGTFDDMASRIQQLVKSQRQLIGDLSHEIRTPLTRIRLLLSSTLPTEERRRRLEHEVTVMQALLDNAVLLARWDSQGAHGSPPLQDSWEAVPVAQLLTVVLDDIAFEFAERPLSANIPPGLVLASGSAFGMTRAIENILRNAMLYTQAGVQVSAWQGTAATFEATLWCAVVTPAVTASGVFVQVDDQGEGVPQAELLQIFEPFYRLDKSRSRASGGSGLGLPIVRQQVKQLKGGLWLRNRADSGLSVCLFFPDLSDLREL